MNKKLKVQLIRHNEEMRMAFPNLYDLRWVEKAATEGFKQLTETLAETDQKLGELARHEKGYNVFAVIYYMAFEKALNTFFHQCLKDTATTMELSLDELNRLTASLVGHGDSPEAL
jgi:hypothetical protein